MLRQIQADCRRGSQYFDLPEADFPEQPGPGFRRQQRTVLNPVVLILVQPPAVEQAESQG